LVSSLTKIIKKPNKINFNKCSISNINSDYEPQKNSEIHGFERHRTTKIELPPRNMSSLGSRNKLTRNSSLDVLNQDDLYHSKIRKMLKSSHDCKKLIQNKFNKLDRQTNDLNCRESSFNSINCITYISIWKRTHNKLYYS